MGPHNEEKCLGAMMVVLTTPRRQVSILRFLAQGKSVGCVQTGPSPRKSLEVKDVRHWLRSIVWDRLKVLLSLGLSARRAGHPKSSPENGPSALLSEAFSVGYSAIAPGGRRRHPPWIERKFLFNRKGYPLD
jgi:hypothetical protein